MAQITTGLRSVLSHPIVYDLVQDLLGARRSRRRLVEEYLRVKPGETLLDVGCGTCAILECLPTDIGYIGVDLSPEYIDSARRRYGDRGRFFCQDVGELDPSTWESANVALAVGLLHHLEDDEVRRLFESISRILAPGGRVVTIDPCYDPSQNAAARFMISRDRGQNVRTGHGYSALASECLPHIRLSIRHDLSRVPYTHAILECSK
jgi:SAM-dependent methyltransferase